MNDRQGLQGFVLLEIIIACLVLGIVASVVLPMAGKFYREAAVEYEAEHLLSEIRRAQSINRLTAEDAVRYGATSNIRSLVVLTVKPTQSRIWIGRNGELWRDDVHYLLPMVRIANESQTNSANNKGNVWKLTFNDESTQSRQLMTLSVYAEGYRKGARRIIISRGRVRMERG